MREAVDVITDKKGQIAGKERDIAMAKLKMQMDMVLEQVQAWDCLGEEKVEFFWVMALITGHFQDELKALKKTY
jgi:hypothetical protein